MLYPKARRGSGIGITATKSREGIVDNLKKVHNMKLEDKKDYPFRASLTKVARCGMCKNYVEPKFEEDIALMDSCIKGHDIVGPTITGEHDCKDYEYRPDVIDMPPNGRIFRFNGYVGGSEAMFNECNGCGHNFMGRCNGIGWVPIRKVNGICEFFRERYKTCKHAIPVLQYGNHIRNNYCRLPPEQRDGDVSRGWKWHCSNAHTSYVESKKCYAPIHAPDEIGGTDEPSEGLGIGISGNEEGES